MSRFLGLLFGLLALFFAGLAGEVLAEFCTGSSMLGGSFKPLYQLLGHLNRFDSITFFIIGVFFAVVFGNHARGLLTAGRRT